MRENVGRALNDRLRRARLERGWTLMQVAQKLDVSYVTVSGWERGTVKPSPRYWKPICKLLGLTIDDFFPPDRGPGTKQWARQKSREAAQPPHSVHAATLAGGAPVSAEMDQSPAAAVNSLLTMLVEAAESAEANLTPSERLMLTKIFEKGLRALEESGEHEQIEQLRRDLYKQENRAALYLTAVGIALLDFLTSPSSQDFGTALARIEAAS
jgi:DNA-binding XRE family transcriptional regulator